MINLLNKTNVSAIQQKQKEAASSNRRTRRYIHTGSTRSGDGVKVEKKRQQDRPPKKEGRKQHHPNKEGGVK